MTTPARARRCSTLVQHRHRFWYHALRRSMVEPGSKGSRPPDHTSRCMMIWLVDLLLLHQKNSYHEAYTTLADERKDSWFRRWMKRYKSKAIDFTRCPTAGLLNPGFQGVAYRAERGSTFRSDGGPQILLANDVDVYSLSTQMVSQVDLDRVDGG